MKTRPSKTLLKWVHAMGSGVGHGTQGPKGPFGAFKVFEKFSTIRGYSEVKVVNFFVTN